jgi:broad specificity phosphatase PhoE
MMILDIDSTETIDSNTKENYIEEDVDYSRSNTIRCTESIFLETKGVKLEKRLRETAKGPRQGFHKSLSLDEAINERKRQGMSKAEFPLHETEDDSWKRATKWLNEIVIDAINESLQPVLNGSSSRNEVEENNSTNLIRSDKSEHSTQNICNVLAVSHSAFCRTFLSRLIGYERLQAHPDAKFDQIDGRFIIPNSSLTIVDIIVSFRHDGRQDFNQFIIPVQPSIWESNPNEIDNPSSSDFKANVEIVELTSTSHYK